MKRLYALGIAILALVALAGCNDTKEFAESLERAIVLTATHEGVSPDTKTLRMDDGSTWWNPKEEISVFYGSGSNGGSKFTSKNTTIAEITEFEGSISMSGNKEFWAVYPYSADNSCDGSSIITDIPSQQTGVEGNFSDDAFPAMGKSGSLSMPFYNICGGIKFFVSRADIKSVTFKGNNGEVLAGKVKVAFGADGKPEVAEVIEGQTEVTLTAPDGGAFKAGKYYYITLLPVALDGGFTMMFNTTSSYGVLNTTRAQVIKRSFIGVLKNVDSKAQAWKDFGNPSISLTPSELLFEKGEQIKSIELLATRDWCVSRSVDWASVDVVSGVASNKSIIINVSVQDIPDYDREGEIIFSIGSDSAVLVVKQKGEKGERPFGSGTKDDPYTVAGVVAYVKSLGNDVISPEKVYVKGIVSNIASDADTYTGSGVFGNAIFKMSDDGTTEGDQFYCYHILYLGNRRFKSGDTDIKVGSNVVVLGKVVNLNGNTPETAQGTAFLFSLEGKDEGDGSVNFGTPSGKGTKDDPFNVAAAYEAVRNLTWTNTIDYQKVGPYYVKGKVSTIDQDYTYNISDGRTYGNARFNISEDGSESAAQFFLYNLNYLGDTKFTQGKKDIKKGDDVIIYAELMNYRGTTLENAGGYLYSLNGDTGSSTPSSSVTGTITETIAVEDGSRVVVPEAIVAALSSQGFIATDGQSNVYVYLKAEPAVKIGDKVKIEGTKTTYYGLPEFIDPTATVLASGVEVPRTELKDITSTIDAYNASVAEFICVTGKLVEDGNYFNVEVPGAARKATPSSLHSSISPKSLVGQQVTMTGYFNTIHSSKNLVQIVVTSITPADPNAKYCSVEPASINVKADVTSASFKITANAAWTAVSDNAAFTVEPASGSADATVSVKFSANESDAARVANIKVSCPDASFEDTVVVTQAKPSSGDAITLSIDFTKEMADLPQASASGITDGTYTWEGQTFILHAADKFYQAKSNDKFYLLIGKQGSYVQFPVIEGKSLVKVEFLTGAAASESVIADLAKADGTRLNVNNDKLKKGTKYEWAVSGEPGAAYRITVTNAFNMQFQTLTLTYDTYE